MENEHRFDEEEVAEILERAAASEAAVGGGAGERIQSLLEPR